MTTQTIPYNQNAVQLWLIRPDNTHVPVPYDRLSHIRLTDGSGLDVANQITVEYKIEDGEGVDPAALVYTHVYVVQRVIDVLRNNAVHDVVHGPYDVVRTKFDNESRLFNIEGTLNLFWEERVATLGTAAEANIVNQINSLFSNDNYGDVEPYSQWIADMGLQTLLSYVQSDLIKVKAFSELVSALERWGFTAYTTTGIFTVQFDGRDITRVADPQVIFVPRYPVNKTTVAVGRAQYELRTRLGTVDLDGVLLTTDFQFFENLVVELPDATNRPESYKTRRIISGFRAFAYADDVRYLVSPAPDVAYTGPTIYKDNIVGEALTQQEHDNARWDLQNTSVEISFEDVWPMPDVRRPNEPLFPLTKYVVPHQRFIALNDQWRVRSVTHDWSGTKGYIRTIHAYQWQGFFERVDGGVV